MKSTSLAAATTVVVLAASLAACSTPGGDDTASSITIWHNSADSPAVLDLYERFEAETGIAVELVDIPSDAFESTTTTKWATGDRPDILEYHPVKSALLPLNPAANMQDLSDLPFVEKSGDLYPAMGTVDGVVYAAITGFPSIFGVYYNKQVLADAGLEPPTSFEDLQSICDGLAGSGVAPIYESGGSAWPTQILPLLYGSEFNAGDEYGSAVAANERPLTEPDGPFVKGLEAYASLRDNGCFNADATSGTFENAITAVYDGTAALTALHSDVYASFLAAAGGDAALLDETVGFVPVSATEPVVAYAGGPIGTFYAPKTGDAAREAAAIQFIEFATGAGYQDLVDAGPAFPVIDGATTPDDFSELQLAFKAAYDDGAAVAFNSNIAGFGGFATETTKLLAGQTTPAEAAESMQAQVEQASKAAGLPGW
ncbi:ABC transporter substrate-binding protein [Schumannella luteola]